MIYSLMVVALWCLHSVGGSILVVVCSEVEGGGKLALALYLK